MVVPRSFTRHLRLVPPAQARDSEPVPRSAERFFVIGLGADVGGPPAIQALLSQLEPRRAPPVLVVQQMSASFLDGFVSWLAGELEFEVSLAQSGALLRPAHVYVAPADRHVTIDGRRRVVLSEMPPRNAQRPPIDTLFESLAERFGADAVGVLLSGMGDDGARGLLAIRESGGTAIVQDDASCVVQTMPRAARELGAAALVAPPTQIGRMLRQFAL